MERVWGLIFSVGDFPCLSACLTWFLVHASKGQSRKSVSTVTSRGSRRCRKLGEKGASKVLQLEVHVVRSACITEVEVGLERRVVPSAAVHGCNVPPCFVFLRILLATSLFLLTGPTCGL